MDLQDDLQDDLIQPKNFLSKIITFKEKLPAILDDFIKYYILFNKNLKNNEYQYLFEIIKGNLQNLKSELSVVTDNIQNNIKKINTKLQDINDLIIKEKNENKKLKKTLGIIEKTNNGSDELIIEYKEMYNLNYLSNFSLFCGIILLGVIISLKFKFRTQIAKV
jgi:hypothetical protein